MAVPVASSYKLDAGRLEASYDSQITKAKELIFKITLDGSDRKEILNDLDMCMKNLKMQFSSILSRQRPFDLFLQEIFEQGTDETTAYRSYMVTNLMENHEMESSCNHLFRAVGYLIYRNKAEADKLIQAHSLGIQAGSHPSFNENLTANLALVIDRARETGEPC